MGAGKKRGAHLCAPLFSASRVAFFKNQLSRHQMSP